MAKTTRINLDLTPEVKVQLENLKTKSSASSLTEVVRRSIALYDFVVDHDKCIFIKDEKGELKEVLVL